MMSPRNLLDKAVDKMLTVGQLVTTNSWQGKRDTPFNMVELLFFEGKCVIPLDKEALASQTFCDNPWAEEHFQERVSGLPTNPGQSYKIWPYFTPGSEDKTFDKFDGRFFATYQERFWPKHAGQHDDEELLDNDDQFKFTYDPNEGIRFSYGDYGDVVNLLAEDPMTRQAYLPLFFPEDTGVRHRDRAMCSLGYHFIIRNGYLHMSYYMRSADLMRHFKNDIYLAGRLMQHTCELLMNSGLDLEPGFLHIYVSNLHVFESDMYTLKKKGIFRTQTQNGKQDD